MTLFFSEASYDRLCPEGGVAFLFLYTFQFDGLLFFLWFCFFVLCFGNKMGSIYPARVIHFLVIATLCVVFFMVAF